MAKPVSIVNKRKDYALITGGTSGIGYALALELSLLGYNIVLVASRKIPLQKAVNALRDKRNVHVEGMCIDLAQPESSAGIVAFCRERNLSISVLVTCAGKGFWGLFGHSDIEIQVQMVRLHNESLLRLCHHFIPLISRNDKGFILNVASTSAFHEIPTIAAYGASKAFVLHFSKSLYLEHKNSNVHVACLVPGPTRTNFISRAGMEPLQESAEQYEMNPEEVARIAVRKLFKKKAVIIPGLINRIHFLLSRIFPGTLSFLVGRVYRTNLGARDSISVHGIIEDPVSKKL